MLQQPKQPPGEAAVEDPARAAAGDPTEVAGGEKETLGEGHGSSQAGELLQGVFEAHVAIGKFISQGPTATGSCVPLEQAGVLGGVGGGEGSANQAV